VRHLLALLAALAAVLALAACGGGGGGDAAQASGDAALLWITRGEGDQVLASTRVEAGDSVLRTLGREVPIETRYGGRFVQAIRGVEGSLSKRRDWFYFVNGIEPGIGAAEVDVHPGDVVWWDYRDWGRQMEAPVVVGAFPEPFLHGWEGTRRPARVVAPEGFGRLARRLLAVLGGSAAQGEPNVFRLVVRPGTDGADLTARRGAADASPVTFTLAGSLTAVRAAAATLVEHPDAVRYRYVARFDDSGAVR